MTSIPMRYSIRLTVMPLAPLLKWTLVGAALWPLSSSPSSPTVVGWLERVRVGGQGLTLEAKLDTGADISSLDAKDIRSFRRNDQEWVAFTVVTESGQVAYFEESVVRIARIRRVMGEAQKRYTVLLGVCLGDTYRLTEVSLVDRDGLRFDFLVGRRFLSGHFAVDAQRTYTTEPRCDASRVK